MDLLQTASRILAGAGVRVDLPVFLALFGLALARIATAVSLAPFFGGQSVSGRIRAGLAVVLTAVLMPGLARHTAGVELSALLYVALLAKEVLVGAMIGIICQFVFYGIQMAGTLIDTQRGMNQMAFVAPQLAGPASSLGVLKLQTAIVVFLALNGHLMYIRALDASFTELPLLGFPSMGAGPLGMAELATRLSASSLVIALEMAAPVMIALSLIDTAFGALGRIASQIQVHQESQPVKALAGIAVLLLASGFIFNRIQHNLEVMILAVNQFVRGLH